MGERVFDTLNHEVLTGGSYTLANARLGYASSNSPWEVAVFCRNFTDEQFVVTAFDISPTVRLTSVDHRVGSGLLPDDEKRG